MPAPTTPIAKDWVTVVVRVDRDTLAAWEETRACDPVAMSDTLLRHVSEIGEHGELAVTLSVAKDWYCLVLDEMGRLDWVEDAIVADLNATAFVTIGGAPVDESEFDSSVAGSRHLEAHAGATLRDLDDEDIPY